MARPSLNPDKAAQGGGGIEAGNYEVLGAKFANIKTDFRPNQLYLALTLGVCDKDGDRVRGADDVDMHVSFGEKSLEAFHPGQADSPTGDAEDQGDAPDAEGNTVYCEDGAQFNKSCGTIVFMESLAKAGFPKNILDRCYADDFVGLKFALASKPPKELNERFGLRLNTKPMTDRKTGQPVDITYKIADKWLNPNYLSGGDAKPKGKANGKVAEDAPALTGKDLAMHVMGEVAKLKAGEKNALKSKNALVGFFTNVFTKGKHKGLPEAQKLVKDDEWLAEAVSELGGFYDTETGVTTFPE